MTGREDDATRRNGRMVDEVVDRHGIRDPRVLDAFRVVPRHLFLPDTPLDEVYSGAAVATHWNESGDVVSSSSEPAVMAQMLDQLNVRLGQNVLEIGSGSGYNAALLARMVGDDGRVTTLDIDPDVVAAAAARLSALPTANVRPLVRDGWLGAPEWGPFDRIEATVAVSDLSTAWVEQLAGDGLLVVPLWLRAGVQASVVFRRAGARLESTSLVPCGFTALRGASAGPETRVKAAGWTVMFEMHDGDEADHVRRLVQGSPVVRPLAPLPSGWFTAIALREERAVTMFWSGPRPRVAYGLLEPDPPGLAVIEVDFLDPTGVALCSFGGSALADRLLDLIGQTSPAEIRELSVVAVPAHDVISDWADCLAVITRREFAFVVGAP